METILITGAGSGIGAATAKLLSQREGIRLLLVGRRKGPLDEVCASLSNADNHVTASVDVADANAVVDFLGSSLADLARSPLVAVFANAGVGGPNTFGEDDRWE